jgi:hypothetical protein
MRAALIAPALLLFALTACGGSKEDNQVTETRMDDIDGLEGTISDDAINMDASTDEAPVEAAPPRSDEPKAKPDKSEAKDTSGPDKAELKAGDAPAK